MEQSQKQSPESVDTKLRPSGTFNSVGTSVVGRVQGVEVKSTLRSVGSVDVIALRAMKSEAADGPIIIIKWPDKMEALVGDIVTMYLKYTNTGGQPITNVIVTDSLTTRFEYVKGRRRQTATLYSRRSPTKWDPTCFAGTSAAPCNHAKAA